MASRMSARVLLVDDDEDVLNSLKLYFKIHFDEVVVSTSPSQINELFNQGHFDLVLLDMNFRQGHNDGKEGIYWLKHIRELDANAAVILLTAYGSIDLAVESLKLGAIDFVVKPWNNQKLLSTALRALELQKSKKKVAQLKVTNRQENKAEDNPIRKSKSLAMQTLLRMAERAAPSDANILIRGENGTGKEVMARYIHSLSGRQDEPFVSVDLGALPDNLIEAELFGARKGAFTDAKEDRLGRFEAAQDGTLFLDEIGNMSLNSQQRLLSALQNRSVTPLGSTQPVEFNTRTVCATNANLEEQVSSGSFRRDLLYRINTIELQLPPLRERTEDIEDLANYFLEKFNRRYQRICTIEPKTIEELEQYAWPGNIRELEHSIERAVILAEEPLLRIEDFSLGRNEKAVKNEESLKLSLEELEANHIKKVLDFYAGNISKAASHLRINRNTLYKKIEKYGL